MGTLFILRPGRCHQGGKDQYGRSMIHGQGGGSLAWRRALNDRESDGRKLTAMCCEKIRIMPAEVVGDAQNGGADYLKGLGLATIKASPALIPFFLLNLLLPSSLSGVALVPDTVHSLFLPLFDDPLKRCPPSFSTSLRYPRSLSSYALSFPPRLSLSPSGPTTWLGTSPTTTASPRRSVVTSDAGLGLPALPPLNRPTLPSRTTTPPRRRRPPRLPIASRPSPRPTPPPVPGSSRLLGLWATTSGFLSLPPPSVSRCSMFGLLKSQTQSRPLASPSASCSGVPAKIGSTASSSSLSPAMHPTPSDSTSA